MNEFVRIRGAKLPETVRFPKICNDVAGQIHPIPPGRKNGFDLLRQKRSTGQEARFSRFFWHLIAVCCAIAG